MGNMKISSLKSEKIVPLLDIVVLEPKGVRLFSSSLVLSKIKEG